MKRHTTALISRRNWRDTRDYLTYCAEVRQNARRTVMFSRTALDHLLNWATDTAFSVVPDLRPAYPVWIAETLAGRAPSYIEKLLSTSRAFFAWARERWPVRYERVRTDWIAGLRSKVRPGRVVTKELYTLENVRDLVAVNARRLVERRDRAAVAFLFLSGMRVGAFVSLPVRSVTFDYQVEVNAAPMVLIRQWPDFGVRTKNSKAANTFLLPHSELADLRAIVWEWHQEVAEGLGQYGMWYALIAPDGETFLDDQAPGIHRSSGLRLRLERLCQRAGVDYLSPHKLRHGHITWARGQCRTISDYKAVSQNVMHATLQITDSKYGMLADGELVSRLAGMGVDVAQLAGDDEILELLENLFRRRVGVK